MKDIITNLTISSEITLITLSNVPSDTKLVSEIFTKLGEANLNIDMISITPPYKGIINLSFTIDDNDLPKALSTLKTFKKSIAQLRMEVNSNNFKISLYGEDMKITPGIAAKTMEILSDNNIDIKLITTSEVDISYLLWNTDGEKAVECFEQFFELK